MCLCPFFIVIAAPLPCSLSRESSYCTVMVFLSLRQALHQYGNFVTFWQRWDCIQQSELEEIQSCSISPYSSPQIYPWSKQMCLKEFDPFSSLKPLYTHSGVRAQRLRSVSTCGWLKLRVWGALLQLVGGSTRALHLPARLHAHARLLHRFCLKCLCELQWGWKSLGPPSALCFVWADRVGVCEVRVRIRVKVGVRLAFSSSIPGKGSPGKGYSGSLLVLS